MTTNREQNEKDRRQLPSRVAITSVLLVLGLLIAAFVSNLLWETCSDRVVDQHTAPGGKWVATWIERDCGATTRRAYHLLLLPPGSKPRFRQRQVIFSCEKLEKHRIRWKGPNELHVEVKCDRIFRQEPEKEGISISYTLE